MNSLQVFVLISVGFMLGAMVCYLVFELKKAKLPKQTTWVFCPGCGKDLCTSPVVVTDTDFVRYYCLTCKYVSVWDFDAPVPLHIETYYLDPNDWMRRKDDR